MKAIGTYMLSHQQQNMTIYHVAEACRLALPPHTSASDLNQVQPHRTDIQGYSTLHKLRGDNAPQQDIQLHQCALRASCL